MRAYTTCGVLTLSYDVTAVKLSVRMAHVVYALITVVMLPGLLYEDRNTTVLQSNCIVRLQN